MRRLIYCTVALVCLGLPGCATTRGGGGLVKSDRNVIDTEKVAMVNQWSRRTGVFVIWINPPQKRVRPNGGLSD